MNTKNVTMETMEYFSSNSEARLRGRETLEVIIPDRYPDAREILLVTGYAYVKAKEQSGHPLLQSILEVVALVESSEKFGSLKWTVETDHGLVSFRIRNRHSDIKQFYGTNRILIRDSNDNRYEIRDYTVLDSHSQRLLFSYL